MTDAFAMLGISLVLCSRLMAWLYAWRVTRLRAMSVKLGVVFCFALMWIPLGQPYMPAAAYVRGITADFSITLIALAVWRLFHLSMGWRAIAKHEETAVMAATAATALLLYPLALGLGDWDAYRPGWGSWGMLLALLVLCTVCWVKGLRVLPALVALALLAWTFGLMESTNLWDYLLDPWLSVFALGHLARKVFIKYGQVLRSRFQ